MNDWIPGRSRTPAKARVQTRRGAPNAMRTRLSRDWTPRGARGGTKAAAPPPSGGGGGAWTPAFAGVRAGRERGR